MREKASGEERKDAITFHTTKVVTTLNAPLRKEITSFLQEPYAYHKGLFAVNSVKSFCHPTLVTHTTEDLHERREQSE